MKKYSGRKDVYGEYIEDADEIVTTVRRKPKWKKILLLFIVIAAAVIFGFYYADKQNSKKSDSTNRVTTISKSTLEKALEISELSTLDYTYNGVAEVKEDDGNIKYHVAYKGTVTAGIDFNKIDISVNNKNMKITMKIPDAVIQDTNVDMGSMEYIFTDEEYNTETVSQEAYKASKSDLKKKADKETKLLSMAKDNAKNSVEALINPWVKQINKEYTVEIK